MLCIIKKDVADFGFKAKIIYLFFAHFANSLQLCAKVVHFIHTRFLFMQMAAEIAEEMR
jgi:hypothetical protein